MESVYSRGKPGVGSMDARLERKLRLYAGIVVSGIVGGTVIPVMLGHGSASGIATGIIYGLLITTMIGGIELFVVEGPMRGWLGDLSFTQNLIVRSTIYAAIIIPIQFFHLGALLVAQPIEPSLDTFWAATIYSGVLAVVMNLVMAITNLVGRRALMNFISGRYHAPVEENRFVLFVDIAGSTGLAERIGGIGIHRFLDSTFRVLTTAVVDYRGEVLNYV